MLSHQEIIITTLIELQETQLLHSDEIFVSDTKLVFGWRIQPVQGCRSPPKLLISCIQFDFLTVDVEVRTICQCDEVDSHDFISMPEEDSINQGTFLVATKLLLSLTNLTRDVLYFISFTSFFLRFTMYYFSPSTRANFYPWRMATVFLLQMMRIWSERSRSNSFAQLIAKWEMESCSKLKLSSAFVLYSRSTLRPWVFVKVIIRIYRGELLRWCCCSRHRDGWCFRESDSLL